MAEFEVARNHFVICIIWRTCGVNFMLVSSTEVFPQICSLSSSAIRTNRKRRTAVSMLLLFKFVKSKRGRGGRVSKVLTHFCQQNWIINLFVEFSALYQSFVEIMLK